MKKTVLIFAFIAMAGSLSAQIPAYRSLAQFNGDIDKYLYFNFEIRCEAYTGKTFADLFKDLEIQPIGFVSAMSFVYGMNKGSYDVRIDLLFKHYSDKYSALDSYISIEWEIPVEGSLVRALTSQYPDEPWVPQHYEFFKNMKIKYVYINDYIVQGRGYENDPAFKVIEPPAPPPANNDPVLLPNPKKPLDNGSGLPKLEVLR